MKNERNISTMENEIMEILCELTREDWVLLYNDYYKASHGREYFHPMEEFDIRYSDLSPLELANKITAGLEGSFNPNEPLYYIDDMGYLCSCHWDYAPVRRKDIVLFMLRTGNNLGCDIVQHVLDEFEV